MYYKHRIYSRDTRLSNSSLNSYSSSSQSSSAAPSTVRYKSAATAAGDLSNDSDSSTSSSSEERDWDYRSKDILPPATNKHNSATYTSVTGRDSPSAAAGGTVDRKQGKSSRRREDGKLT